MIFNFLAYGKSIPSMIEQPLQNTVIQPGTRTVAFEARYLKSLFLKFV